MKPIVNVKHVHIVHDMYNKPQLFIGRVIDIMDNKPQLFIGVINIAEPRIGFYPVMLRWLDGKPALKSVLIRLGVRFIVKKLLDLLKSVRSGGKQS